MARKRVLLTGAAGFIGAHCLEYWMEHTDWQIIALDSFRHKGYVSRFTDIYHRLQKFDDGTRFGSFAHDLSVPIDLPLENMLLRRWLDNGVVREEPFDIIVNMASDSAVERSTTNPVQCLRNNYELMINMLEFARKVKPKVFIHISTDEVYGEAPPLPHPGHREWDSIVPSNPYAASKAAQEALAIAYWRTYDVPVVITNTMNVIGERQDPEKFLPKIVQCIAQGRELPIYADKVGQESEGEVWRIGSRVYLDAKNKASALQFIAGLPVAKYSQGAKLPDRYNICGDVELNNLELAQRVAKIMRRELKYKLVASESARPGYDRRYALDGDKLRNKGWRPPFTFEQSLERIVQWTMHSNEWLV